MAISALNPTRIDLQNIAVGGLGTEAILDRHLEILSNGLPIAVQNTTENIKPESVISNLFGYASVINTNNTCGPASMASVMDYYGFGWNDTPIDSADGHYRNDPYVQRVMQWSDAPDVLFGFLGTSPMRIVDTVNKLGLKAVWYGKSGFPNTLSRIKNEIDNGRPVFVLLDWGQINQGHFILDWQVAFAHDNAGIVCKISSGRNHWRKYDYATFDKLMHNNIPNCDQTFITVNK